jgi:hypothetical protein
MNVIVRMTLTIILAVELLATSCPTFAAEVGGKPEKSEVVVTYAQPSGAFTPIWVAYEAGLFKKYGLNAKVQLMTPQVSAQAVVSEEAIAKYVKIDDAPTIDGTYDAFAPYWEISLNVRAEAIQAQFSYMDEKEFPQAKNSDPKEFFDNSFVEALDKAGFFKSVGLTK